MPTFFFGSKFHVLIMMLILAVINYFVLYWKEHYIDVFDNFDSSSDKYKGWNKYVPLYVVGSVLFLVVVLLIADYRYDGHL